jgi:hypothetical protein
MTVPQVNDSMELNINSCSIVGHPLKTVKSALIKTYSMGLEVTATGTSMFRHYFTFQVLPHCTDYTQMISPTLPPQSFDFTAGMV